ncbi:MAG TPA: transcription antitermination factor NusB [Egibacteraceae bacterium]|nr:transcription antitermination factor NusB [Egibacteraceae bacterium]
MGRESRRGSRKRALDILYEADLKDEPIPIVLARHLAAPGVDPAPLSEFATALVRGVHRSREEIDQVIQAHARDWKLSRMPIIDRNILRIALFELLHSDVPKAVAIDEAVELAKWLSTEDSGRFINGLLARAAQDRPAGETEAPDAEGAGDSGAAGAGD